MRRDGAEGVGGVGFGVPGRGTRKKNMRVLGGKGGPEGVRRGLGVPRTGVAGVAGSGPRGSRSKPQDATSAKKKKFEGAEEGGRKV